MIGHQERGRRITESGRKLEKWFESYLKRIGYKAYKGSDEEFLDKIPKGKHYIRRANVGLSESGAYAVNLRRGSGVQYADFVLSGLAGYKKTGLRVECKRQDSRGSADEKLDYTVANINRAGIPAVIGWVGKGWMNGAIERTEAKVNTSSSLVGVFEMEEVKVLLGRLLR